MRVAAARAVQKVGVNVETFSRWLKAPTRMKRLAPESETPKKDRKNKDHTMLLARPVLRALLLLSLMAVSMAASSTPGVVLLEQQPYHTGKFVLRELDLWVQAKGLPVRVTRTYTSGKGWQWNRRWESLQLKKNQTFLSSAGGQSGGTVQSGTGDAPPPAHYEQWDYLKRGDIKFERVPDQPRFGFFGSHIEPTPEGFTWKDREGNWIRYDQSGLTLSYGDSEGNEYRLIRDAKARISAVKDKYERTLLTLTYAGSDATQPEAVVDYSGRSVHYHYDSDGRLSGVTDVLGNRWVYEYDDQELVRRIDPENRATTYNWEDGRVDEIVKADGSSIAYAFDYDKSGGGAGYYRFTIKGDDGTVSEQKIWNADAKRLMIRASYPAAANIESIASFTSTSADEKEVFSHTVNGEQVTKVVYNWKDKIRKTTDQLGQVTAVEEDQWGNPLKTTYPDGSVETQTYDDQYNYPTSVTNKAGTEFRYAYDAAGRLTKVSEAVNTPAARTVSFSHTEFSTIATFSGPGGNSFSQSSYFDDRGNLERWMDGEGYETTYAYDVMGNLTSLTTPRGTTYTYTYDAAGNLLTETDPLGRTISYAYDKVGNLVTETAPNLSKTKYGYDALNQWNEVTNQLGQKAKRTYDVQSRTMSAMSADTTRVTERYNAYGQPLEVSDALGNDIHYTYENFLLKEVQFPTFKKVYEYNNQQLVSSIATQFDGQSTTQQFEYDVLGQLVRTLNDDNHAAQYEYDELGRVTRVVDADMGVTRLYWDHRNNLVRVIDPEDREVRLEYDTNGYLTAEVFRSEGSDRRREYRYDGNGNLTRVISPGGETLVYTYDSADQMIRLDVYAGQSDATPAKTVDYTYNDLGLLASYNDGQTSAAYTYTELGQLDTVTTDYGPFSKSFRYQYNEDGVLSAYTTPEGDTYQYGYNEAGRPSSVVIPGIGTIGISDYQWTQPRTITLPGGSRIERTFNGVMHMTGNRLLDPAQNAVMQVLYGYDNVGNVVSQSTEHGDYQYGYDQLYRLISADYPDKREESFSYDGVGNRTQHFEVADSGTSEALSLDYNDGNQLVRRGDTYFHYDANGNLLSKGPNADGTNADRRYVYDAEQRLARVEDSNGTVIARYGYNPLGHRLWKEVNGVITYFLYTSSGLTAEYDASGNLLKEYQYLPSSPWMTNPLIMRQGGETFYYQVDHFGRPLTLIRDSGEVVWEGRYEAFGAASVVVSKVENNLRLAGQYFDAETGLHHNFMRDYDPALGRYIQADPVGFAGGVNRYAYARLSPLMAIDPYGMAWYEYIDWVFDLIAPKDEYGMPIPIPQDIVDGVTGFGDGMSGGFSRWTREQLGIGGGVNYCSSAYRFSNLTGQFATPGGGSLLALKSLKRVTALAKGRKSAAATRKSLGNPCKCFVAGTLVQTESGLVPIENIQVGDRVWAKQDVTGEVKLKPVLALYQSEAKPVVKVTLKDRDGNLEEIGATPEHPFWLSGKSWTRSEKLNPGDLVTSRGGETLAVVSVEHQETMQPTFNFEVADFHSYFVGVDEVWVHNVCKLPPNSRAKSRAKRKAAREAQRQFGTPTSRPGKNHQNWEPGSPRHQTKEGADGALDGIVDGSGDRVEGHGPHMEVGKLKSREPFTKRNQPRLRSGKSKVDF
ncbi:polymorphic toxin-type HINT domain-containing protein [Marinobacter sp. C2H3]|uniref:polymorphic toxin-type HINT domain-containing protein n=1 Tax=Marinobacter sp. C2H3 TaxID=3119003 RepID=UPI00300F1FCD